MAAPFPLVLFSVSTLVGSFLSCISILGFWISCPALLVWAADYAWFNSRLLSACWSVLALEMLSLFFAAHCIALCTFILASLSSILIGIFWLFGFAVFFWCSILCVPLIFLLIAVACIFCILWARVLRLVLRGRVRLYSVGNGKAQETSCGVVILRWDHWQLLLEGLLVHLVEVIKRGVNGEFAFQNLAVNHGDYCRAKVIANLNELTSFYLLVIFNRLSFLALQVLILRVKFCVKSGLKGVWVYYSHLLKHYQSGSSFFVPLIRELAVTERE